MSDKIIAQVCLKNPYKNDKNVEPIRLRDATQPIIVDPFTFSKKLRLTKEDLSRGKIEWIIPYAIAKGTINIIYAPAGSGKTFAAWGMAKLAYLTHRVRTVFYLDGDNGLETLFNRRVDEIIKYQNFNYLSLNSPRSDEVFDRLGLKNIKTNEELIQGYANSPVDYSNCLFVVDSLKDFVGRSDIESGKDMNEYFRSVLMRLRGKGATILALHHTNKQPKDKNGEPDERGLTFTGSQMILNSADAAYLVLQRNRATNKRDNRIDYKFVSEKDRIGGAVLALSVFTKATDTHKIYDVCVDIPKLSDYVCEKEIKIIENIQNILKDNDGILPLETVYKLLKKHRRDKKISKILDDYNGIFWSKPYKSSHNKAKISLNIS